MNTGFEEGKPEAGWKEAAGRSGGRETGAQESLFQTSFLSVLRPFGSLPVMIPRQEQGRGGGPGGIPCFRPPEEPWLAAGSPPWDGRWGSSGQRTGPFGDLIR